MRAFARRVARVTAVCGAIGAIISIVLKWDELQARCGHLALSPCLRQLVLTGRFPYRSDDKNISTELAKRLQQSLYTAGCYRGPVNGIWDQETEQALALYAQVNGFELQDLRPTLENMLRVDEGVSAVCFRPGEMDQPKNQCVPKRGAVVLSEPDLGKPHPEWQGTDTVGGAWTLDKASRISNPKGRYVYGELVSPRGGYKKWVYGRADQWDCHW